MNARQILAAQLCTTFLQRNGNIISKIKLANSKMERLNGLTFPEVDP